MGAAPIAATNARRRIETYLRARAEALNAPSHQNSANWAEWFMGKRHTGTDTAHARACGRCLPGHSSVREAVGDAGRNSTTREPQCGWTIPRHGAPGEWFEVPITRNRNAAAISKMQEPPRCSLRNRFSLQSATARSYSRTSAGNRPFSRASADSTASCCPMCSRKGSGP